MDGTYHLDGPWRLGRIAIGTRLAPDRGPFARVEIEHATRGRLIEIASGPGPLDCVFEAIRRILGIDATVRELDLDFRGRTLRILILVGGREYCGVARSPDPFRGCALAFLDALGRADRDRG